MGGSKITALVMRFFLLAFYVAIVLYVLLGVLHIDSMENFLVGIIFQIIGFCVLFFLILAGAGEQKLHLGYFVPIFIITVIYTVLLNVINMVAIAYAGKSIFLLLHLLLLFVYCLITMPMYYMGRK